MRQDPERVFEGLLRKYLRDNLEPGNVSTECPNENTVSAYLEGRLPQHLRSDFENHASHCARCQNELRLLLKSEDVAAASSSIALSVQEPKEGWFKIVQAGFDWFSNVGFKAALAVVTVTLISGYVGFELLQRESKRKESAAEVAQSTPQDRGGVMEANRSQPAQKMEREETKSKLHPPNVENEELRVSKEGYLRTDKKVVGAERVTALDGAISKDANREKSLRDADSVAPSEPLEANKRLMLGSRSDSLSRRGAVAGLPAVPSPQPPSSVVREQKADASNLLKSAPPEGRVNVATTQSVPENQPVLENAQPSADEEAQSKTDFRAKEASLQNSKLHNQSVGGAVAPGKLKQEASAGPKAESAKGPQQDRKRRQLRVAGKTFELQSNVWTDLSIREDPERADVVIYKDSSDYPEQIKPLSAYQSVLSRDEDCRIEFQGKVYHVKGPR